MHQKRGGALIGKDTRGGGGLLRKVLPRNLGLLGSGKARRKKDVRVVFIKATPAWPRQLVQEKGGPPTLCGNTGRLPLRKKGGRAGGRH